MAKEVIRYLAPHPNEDFIDATVGFGGHAEKILEKTAPGGKLLVLDQDSIALEQAKKNLEKFNQRVTFVNQNFSQLGLVIRSWDVKKIDGIFFDLGVSTYQLQTPERGFSFNVASRLDMRMDPHRQRLTAEEIINNWSGSFLKRIFKEFGEEPFASKIAREIVKARSHHLIEKTDELVEIIKKAMPPKYRFSRTKHFATSTFRALRMAVNDELKVLESGLKQAIQILSPGGRLVVISFHSLEDRIIKKFFAENEHLKVLTPKPIIASVKEITNNPKARSAKLRAAIKNVNNLKIDN